jgi:hypothetical protein
MTKGFIVAITSLCLKGQYKVIRLHINIRTGQPEPAAVMPGCGAAVSCNLKAAVHVSIAGGSRMPLAEIVKSRKAIL